MQLYEAQVTKTSITRAAPAKIPKGITGAVLRLGFSPEWEGLSKTVVFRAGEITKDVVGVENEAVIPVECVQQAGTLLEVGVYGVDADNTVAIPTLWAAIGRVFEGTEPSEDTTTDPTLPVWAQILDMVKQLEQQGVTQNEVEQAVRDFFGGELPAGRTTPAGGEIFNYYTKEVVTGDGQTFPGNTANKGAHAEGFGVHADGEYAHAEGWNAYATGGIAHAEGRETNATGYGSHAEGRETNATGSYAHAEGYKSEAIGGSSHAEGNETKATADFTHAEGQLTEASAMYAHAEGYKAKATGAIAHAQGRETEASGYASHTQNHTTKATGYASSAAGRGTIAAGKDQFVVGRFNQEVGDDYLFVVGNGTSDTDRKNCYTLDKNGNARFAGKVYSEGVEVAAVTKTASKKTFSVAAGGSVTVTLPGEGLFVVSFSDNARRGCVLLQTHEKGVYTESNTLLELSNWAFSADGLNLTISETGGKWAGIACITALGRKNI